MATPAASQSAQAAAQPAAGAGGDASQADSSQPAVDPAASEDSAVMEFLAILEQHRAECEANHQYVEAEVATRRLQELRAHEVKRRKEAYRSRHIAEKLDVEEAHLLEIEEFNKRWNEQMQEYEKECAEQEQALRERHAAELLEWQQKLQDKFLLRPKYSKELLNLRKIEETLAKAKEYTEAQKVKMKGDAMQKWELEDLKKEWRRKIGLKQTMFVKQQQAELDAFRLRVVAGHEKQKRLRQVRLNKILKRYHNLKSDLDKKHSLERTRADKFAELQTRVINSGGSPRVSGAAGDLSADGGQNGSAGAGAGAGAGLDASMPAAGAGAGGSPSSSRSLAAATAAIAAGGGTASDSATMYRAYAHRSADSKRSGAGAGVGAGAGAGAGYGSSNGTSNGSGPASARGPGPSPYASSQLTPLTARSLPGDRSGGGSGSSTQRSRVSSFKPSQGTPYGRNPRPPGARAKQPASSSGSGSSTARSLPPVGRKSAGGRTPAEVKQRQQLAEFLA